MRFAGHTHFLTIGQAIGEAVCPVPTCGLDWLKTFQPVVLEHWPTANDIRHDGLTTVGHWRGYGSSNTKATIMGRKLIRCANS